MKWSIWTGRDVDLQRGRLTIRNAKFGKSRMIFCHETTRQQLIGYARQREARFCAPNSCAFFLSERGRRIHSSTLQKTFRNLVQTTGLREPCDSYGPRLHDMRHTFAVNTLRQWHLDGIDVERWLLRLSTWLGHAGITETYWYLSAVPQLMAAAAQRRL